MVKCKEKSNFEVKSLLSDTVGLGGAIVARVGAYLGSLGFALGPDAESRVWPAPVDKFRSRAAVFRNFSGFLGDRLPAYKTHTLRILWYEARLACPDRHVAATDLAARASMLSAPMHAFTPEMLESIATWGARAPMPTMATTARATQRRVVAMRPRPRQHLALEAHRSHGDSRLARVRPRWAERGPIGVFREAAPRLDALPRNREGAAAPEGDREASDNRALQRGSAISCLPAAFAAFLRRAPAPGEVGLMSVRMRLVSVLCA